MSTDITANYSQRVQQPLDQAYMRDEQQVAARKAAPQETQSQVAARREQLVSAIAKSENIAPGRLVIERDADTQRFVHKIVDPESGETVRQWPEEQWLDMVKDLEKAYGVWLDKRV